MSDVKSKNLFELLGNDHEYDSDKEPEPPTKAVDKALPRAGKRDAPKTEATGSDGAAPRRTYERRGGGFTDDQRGFRERTNNRNRPEGLPANQNRDHPIENTDGTVRGRDSGPGVQRGGRGQRGPRRGGDRHVNRTGRAEHPKQEGQGWGHQTGEGEQLDEKAGEQLAQADKKDEIAEDAAAPAEPIPEPEPEPEDTNMSYAEYLEQQAQKKNEGLGLREARAPNEGAKENKKWKNAAALSKAETEAYFVGEAKAKRERERVQKKQVLDIDYAFKEPARESRGEGRGARGGRGRGEGRGGRGRGEGRGDFRPRGDRGDRGSYGGGRGGRGRSDASGPAVPVSDNSAFPALGGK